MLLHCSCVANGFSWEDVSHFLTQLLPASDILLMPYDTAIILSGLNGTDEQLCSNVQVNAKRVKECRDGLELIHLAAKVLVVRVITLRVGIDGR